MAIRRIGNIVLGLYVILLALRFRPFLETALDGTMSATQCGALLALLLPLVLLVLLRRHDPS